MNNTSPEISDWPLTDVVARIRKAGTGGELSVQDIVEALGRASFGPLLLAPGLLVMSPLSGIPGLSSLGGITIALISIQMVFGRDHIWLPRWIMRQSVERSRMEKALNAIERPMHVVDRVTKPRLSFFARRPLVLIPEILCLACGLAMPFLELVPFSSSLLATVVTLCAVGMVTRDGLFTALALLFLVGGGAGIVVFVR